jgi:hypothetical protein
MVFYNKVITYLLKINFKIKFKKKRRIKKKLITTLEKNENKKERKVCLEISLANAASVQPCQFLLERLTQTLLSVEESSRAQHS